MKEEPGNSYSGIVIFFLALLNVVIHLYVSDNLEYHRDELLYFSLGLHPAAGYATVPPMIGWIAGISPILITTLLIAFSGLPLLEKKYKTDTWLLPLPGKWEAQAMREFLLQQVLQFP